MTASVATGSFIPTGGGAVTILIVSIFVGVACAMIAIETNRNLWGWMLANVVSSFVIINARHAVVEVNGLRVWTYPAAGHAPRHPRVPMRTPIGGLPCR